MTIQWPTDGNPDLRGGKLRKLKEAHNRAQQQAQARRRNNTPRVGSVRLSNTDSLRTALGLRRRVLAKLAEVASAVDVEPRTRDAMVATVKMQLDRIDQQIAAIRRRERAVEEERRARRDECPERRRRRHRDMQERSISVRRDFLYPAHKGGFDPRNPLGFVSIPSPAVSFDIGGAAGIVMDASAPAPSMEMTL